MEQDWDTAVAVATGELNAQEAFVTGRIRFQGDQQLLIESQPLFAALLILPLGVKEPLARELILMCAIPSSAFAVLLAPRYGAYETEGASTLVLTSFAMIAVLPVIIAFSVYFFGRVRGSFKKMDDAEGAMTATLQENLSGIRVVRAFARQQFEDAGRGTRLDQG